MSQYLAQSLGVQMKKILSEGTVERISLDGPFRPYGCNPVELTNADAYTHGIQIEGRIPRASEAFQRSQRVEVGNPSRDGTLATAWLEGALPVNLNYSPVLAGSTTAA
jgi:hypothetical protein